MWAGAVEVFLNPRRLFLFFEDIIIGCSASSVRTEGFVAPRGVAFALAPGTGTGGAVLLARSRVRFFRRRSLRACVSGFPNPGGTGAACGTGSFLASFEEAEGRRRGGRSSPEEDDVLLESKSESEVDSESEEEVLFEQEVEQDEDGPLSDSI